MRTIFPYQLVLQLDDQRRLICHGEIEGLDNEQTGTGTIHQEKWKEGKWVRCRTAWPDRMPALRRMAMEVERLAGGWGARSQAVMDALADPANASLTRREIARRLGVTSMLVSYVANRMGIPPRRVSRKRKRQD